VKAAGMFISTLLIIDTFLISYAVGFNTRHVLMVDPSLPPVQAKEEEPAPNPSKKDAKASAQSDKDAKQAAPTKGSTDHKSGKQSHHKTSGTDKKSATAKEHAKSKEKAKAHVKDQTGKSGKDPVKSQDK
jgi:hypothetical protein